MFPDVLDDFDVTSPVKLVGKNSDSANWPGYEAGTAAKSQEKINYRHLTEIHQSRFYGLSLMRTLNSSPQKQELTAVWYPHYLP